MAVSFGAGATSALAAVLERGHGVFPIGMAGMADEIIVRAVSRLPFRIVSEE